MKISGKSVLVIGGGAAGCSAALSLAEAGYSVTLAESRRYLGGRASSIEFDGTLVDNGQHLVLNACTETRKLIRRIGAENKFRTVEEYRFLCPDFRRMPKISFSSIKSPRFWSFRSVDFFPGLLRFLPSFLASFWTFSEKYALARGLFRLKSNPPNPDIPFGCWLENNRISPDLVRTFFDPAILSALCEQSAYVSTAAVQKVLWEGLLTKHGTRFFLPIVPLRTIFHDSMLDALRRAGVRVLLGEAVQRLGASESGRSISAAFFRSGTCIGADRYVLAVPNQTAETILTRSGWEDFARTLKTGPAGAISAFHFWLDCPLSAEPLVLDSAPGQWLFRGPFADNVPNNPGGTPAESHHTGYYHQVLISASHRLKKSGYPCFSATAEKIEAQLQAVFGPLTVKKRFISTVPNAVNTPQASIWGKRPNGQTPFNNLSLAGDWLETGWPSTLEGAVRSGIQLVQEWRR